MKVSWNLLYIHVLAKLLLQSLSIHLWNKTYIPQPALWTELSLFTGHAGVEYIVVNGPKGAGKSTLIYQAMSIVQAAIRNHCLDNSEFSERLKDICEVEGAWTIEAVEDTSRLTNHWATGLPLSWSLCRGIIVLSDDLAWPPLPCQRIPV